MFTPLNRSQNVYIILFWTEFCIINKILFFRISNILCKKCVCKYKCWGSRGQMPLLNTQYYSE